MPKKIQIRPPGLKPTTKVGTLGTLPRAARPRVGHRAARGRGRDHRRRLLRALPLMLEAYCWPQSVAPGEPAGLHVSSRHRRVRRRGRARGGRTRGRVALATGGGRRSRDPCRRRSRRLRLARGDRDPGRTLAIRLLLRDRHGGRRARRRLPGGSARRPARRASRSCSCSPPPRGTPTTTGAVRRSTPAARASRSNGRWRPGSCVKPEPARRKMQPEPDREGRWFFEWAEPLGLSVWSGGAGWWNWERPFVRWAESATVTASTSRSVRTSSNTPRCSRATACTPAWATTSTGRGACATPSTRSPTAGGNAMILSGNTCFWQVRFDEDHRTMTCFKYRADEDPVVGTPDERFLTGPWSDRRIGTARDLARSASRSPAAATRATGSACRAARARTRCGAPSTGRSRARTCATATRSAATTRSWPTRWTACELATGPDGLPVPTHADGAPESLEILATAPARLWAQDEQPCRYAHEPGRAREHRDGRVRPGLARPGASRHEQPRVHGGVLQARRRHRLQRRRHRLGLRAGVRRPRRRRGSPATCSNG